MARVGDPVALGGGAVSEADNLSRYELLASQVPESCHTPEIWLTGMVAPAGT